MFEVKTNEEIGIYLKKRITDMYETQSNFCGYYVDLAFNELDELSRTEEIRKMRNRLSQILKGIKGIQIKDLPIFSKLLELSCEDILSAGESKLPILNRVTNYNIAFSKNEKDWNEYLSNEEYIYSYLDEYGKSVVDYAFEFENYELLKFLIKNNKISFISNIYYTNEIGAFTTLKPDHYHRPTIEDEFIDNKVSLRINMINLALKYNDLFILQEMKARVIPTQNHITYWQMNLQLDEYYNEELINGIVNSKDKIFKYFCEKYVESNFSNIEIEWLYPYLDNVFNILIKQKKYKRANYLIDILIAHNKDIFNKVKSSIYSKAKELKKLYNNESYQYVLQNILRDYMSSDDNKVISFNSYRTREHIAFINNIFFINEKSDDVNLQHKIDELNDIHNKIINIKDFLIKE